MAIDDFDKYVGNLKTYLPDVEDASFSWADVIGLLVIKLRNTDSLNKARTASHATQIQLTSESGASEGKRKTEDFFPTLTLNSSFKSWRIAIPTRIHRDNILQLDSNDKGITEKWIDDSIQIRRRILNEDEQGNGNPALQICYGNDLMPLRELLNVDDYIVVVKRKNSQVYEAFGVRSDVDLGSGKQLYVSTKASNDSTAFSLGDLTDNPEGWMRLEQKRISTGQNVLLYGVPGSGKSWTIEHEYCKPGTKVERLVFHPDYTYSDFIGQILPAVDEGGQVSYKFTPGPFTNILREAYNHPAEEYILIIEEINRGNAPAIFGEVFQLLNTMSKLLFCEYNMDTACVELKFTDGSMIAIDTIAVENEIADNMYQRSELDWLIYNKPLEYAQLVLEGNLEEYVQSAAEHRLID